MAAVLEFRSDMRRPRRSPMASYGGATRAFGEVVIFPGVRVERHDEDDSVDLGHRVAAGPATVRAGEPADEDA